MVIESAKNNGISLYLQKTDGYYVNYTFKGTELDEPYAFDNYRDAIELYREMEADLLK